MAVRPRRTVRLRFGTPSEELVMRYLACVAVLVLAGVAEGGERQRFRVVNRVPAFEVVNNCGTCTYCTDCKCAAGDCPGKCPVQAAVVPVSYSSACPGGVCPLPVSSGTTAAPVVSSCAGGNCAAPVPSRGLFGLRRW